MTVEVLSEKLLTTKLSKGCLSAVFSILSYFSPCTVLLIHIPIKCNFRISQNQVLELCNCTNNHDSSLILPERRQRSHMVVYGLQLVLRRHIALEKYYKCVNISRIKGKCLNVFGKECCNLDRISREVPALLRHFV